MAKIKERSLAQKLRGQGYSIGDISKKLLVSKSTVSGWCKDIRLSENTLKKIANRSQTKSTLALLRYSEERRNKRIRDTAESIKKGKNFLSTLNKRDIYCIGLGLYWGEGYKTGSQEFGFTNSDPRMIIFYIRWLETVFGISKDRLILRVGINAVHEHRVSEVESYWSKLTAIPKSQFTRSSLIRSKSKKVYKNTNKHMGTLRIKVSKGTALRREVLGAIATIDELIV